MTTQFTKEKWTLRKIEQEDKYYLTVPAEDGLVYEIAEMHFGFTGRFEREQHANAALIADAPAMFELLKRIVDQQTTSQFGFVSHKIIREASGLLERHES